MLDAFAKVNLSLRVRPRDASGFHPLRSLARSVSWHDTVSLADAEEDGIEVRGDLEVPTDDTNLAWKAVASARQAAGGAVPQEVTLHKRIPAAAGMAGGSADAAAALVLAARRFGLDDASRDGLAAGLGADVPFCLTGGAVWMEGRGELLTPVPAEADFALAIAVPPFRLATADVYRRWDEMGEPEGPAIEGRDLPVSLRGHGRLGNDLTPAAVDLEEGLGDWIAGLRSRWGLPVAMTGSGPALFAYFPTRDEADHAAQAVSGARAAAGCVPVGEGWRETPAGTLP
jgi:4-diphosphocytidyl-2-C-methyl-D-erythritol kinase